MRPVSHARVLIVAHQTADSAQLIDAVSRRAQEGPCTFTLLVPTRPRGLHRVVDPEDHGVAEAQRRLAEVLPLLATAARSEVTGMVGSHEPLAAIQDALNLIGFDEVMISMLPARLSRWLHLDLPRKVSGLGVGVTQVLAPEHALTDLPAA
jgi:hypothetical protein